LVNNYHIQIQFDGTEYHGWQSQRPEYRTVESEINRALRIIAKKRILIASSSRTDAGVHARGLNASFHLPVDIEPASLQRALNSLLPADIRVVYCRVAPRSFNARFGARSKTYEYRIFIGPVHSPFAQRYAVHIPYPLDIRAMKRALKYFKGEKDFSSFTSREAKENRVREITRIRMKVRRQEIVVTVKGRSFLRYMVRNIVGTIIDVGRGKIGTADIPDIFAARDRRRAGVTAPAKGLCLKEVDY